MPSQAAPSWVWLCRSLRVSHPAAVRLTFPSLATIHSNTTSVVGSSRPWASALTCSLKTWRGNFASMDEKNLITDRRAGRIPTELNEKLVALLRDIQLPGVQTFVEAVKEYRFVLVLRPTEGQILHANIADTDPQKLGVPPLPAEPEDEASQATARLVNDWIAAAREILKDHHPANSLNLRGLAKDPGLPKFGEVYGLRAAAIATYPMYKGVAKLVGMDVLPVGGEDVEDEVETLRSHWADYDYFFFHVKKTDSAGEDGDFERKAAVIEHVDQAVVPAVLQMEPDVLIVTGDHSTPSVLRRKVLFAEEPDLSGAFEAIVLGRDDGLVLSSSDLVDGFGKMLYNVESIVHELCFGQMFGGCSCVSRQHVYPAACL